MLKLRLVHAHPHLQAKWEMARQAPRASSPRKRCLRNKEQNRFQDSMDYLIITFNIRNKTYIIV